MKKPSPTNSRRASFLTDLFARPSLSDTFQEKHVQPTNILAMIYLRDPNPNIEVLRSTIGERILRSPRFSSVFRLQNNKIYYDPIPHENVDLFYHIRSIDGNGMFDKDDINNLITQASYHTWEPDRPLWKIDIVTNMKDGRCMLFCQIDHTIGDGIAMINVLQLLLDGTSSWSDHSKQYRRSKLPSARLSHRLVCFLYGCYYGLIGWTLESQDTDNGLKISPEKSLSEATSKTFNQIKAYDLTKIKHMQKVMKGTTVNDIMIGVLSNSIRRYFEKTEDPILKKIDQGVKLHAMAPVNVRSNTCAESDTDTKNDIIMANFELPLRHSGIVDAVWKSKAMMDDAKLSPALYLIKHIGMKLVEALPESLIIESTMENVRKPTCLISNVRGPSSQSSLAGYIMDDLNFLVSTPIGLYIGILSYNNKLNISFATDKGTNINCDLFEECIDNSLRDLEKLMMEESKEGGISKPDMTGVSARVLEMLLVPCIMFALHWVLSQNLH